ncbi:hypothetical protein HZS_3550, partial [Henneguya salminicola]
NIAKVLRFIDSKITHALWDLSHIYIVAFILTNKNSKMKAFFLLLWINIYIQSHFCEFPSTVNIVRFLQEKTLLALPNDLNKQKILSIMKVLSKNHPYEDLQKKTLCNHLESQQEIHKDMDSESLFYLLDSETYLGCYNLKFSENLLISVKEKSKSSQSLYYLWKILQLPVKKGKKTIPYSKEIKAAFEDIQFIGAKSTDTIDDIYNLIMHCNKGRTDKEIESLLSQLIINLPTEDYTNSIENFTLSTLYLYALSDCHKLNHVNDVYFIIYYAKANLLSFLKYLENHFSYQVSQLQYICPLLNHLYHDKSLIYLKLFHGNFFKDEDETKSVELSVRNYFTTEKLEVKTDILVEHSQCDGSAISTKDVNLSLHNGVIRLSIPSKHNDCNFKLKIKLPSSNFNTVLNDEHKISISSDKKFKLVDITVYLTDSLDSDSFNSHSVKFMSDIGSLIHQNLIKFSIEFYLTCENTRVFPRQVFLYLHNDQHNNMVAFPGHPNSNNRYNIEFDIYTHARDKFYYLSGNYSMKLVIGDSSSPSLLKWDMVALHSCINIRAKYI